LVVRGLTPREIHRLVGCFSAMAIYLPLSDKNQGKSLLDYVTIEFM
jgi:hypothetical protein